MQTCFWAIISAAVHGITPCAYGNAKQCHNQDLILAVHHYQLIEVLGSKKPSDHWSLFC
jgi:hypothetical protein